MDEAEHPLRSWRAKKNFSHEDVSRLVAAMGGHMGARYCDAIERGWRRPSYELCKALVKVVSEDAFTIDLLRTFPLRTPKHAEKRSKSEKSAA